MSKATKFAPDLNEERCSAAPHCKSRWIHQRLDTYFARETSMC
jgi:hypothetical protein